MFTDERKLYIRLYRCSNRLPLTSMNEIMTLIYPNHYFEYLSHYKEINFHSPKPSKMTIYIISIASFWHKFCAFSACFSLFFHVFNKKFSFLTVTDIWSYGKHLIFDTRLLCGQWSIFSGRCPRGWTTRFLFLVDCPSKLHTIYSVIDSLSVFIVLYMIA